MALIVPKSDITQEQKGRMRQMLIVQPKFDFITKSYPDPVVFMQSIGDSIHVPFAYGVVEGFPLPDKPRVSFSFTGSLLPRQVPVLEEGLYYLDRDGSVLYNVNCGFGKTVLAMKSSAHFGYITVVVMTRNVLAVQWVKNFQMRTDARVSTDLNEDADVYVIMDTCLGKYSVEQWSKVGCLIIDEIHMFSTPSHVSILNITPVKIIGLSATIERDDGMQVMTTLLCGINVITRISDKPNLVYKYITRHRVEQKKNKLGFNDHGDYCRQLFKVEERNGDILNLVLMNPNEKIMIMTSYKPHATYLFQCLQQLGVSVARFFDKDKTYNDADVLVGTMQKLGTGFDEETACANWNGRRINLLIFVTTTKKIEQKVGRVLRADFPITIHFVDDGEMSEKHWKVCEKWYRSRNSTIVEHREPILCIDECQGESVLQESVEITSSQDCQASQDVDDGEEEEEDI